MVGDFFMPWSDLPGGYCLAKKNPSEVADHAADLPGRCCVAVARQYFAADQRWSREFLSENFNKKRLK